MVLVTVGSVVKAVAVVRVEWVVAAMAVAARGGEGGGDGGGAGGSCGGGCGSGGKENGGNESRWRWL